MPSKASEWAKAAHRAGMLEPGRFEAEAEATGVVDYPNKPPSQVCLAVGRRNDSETLCWTDHRVGGVVISAHAAVTMARWILDTFGEATP